MSILRVGATARNAGNTIATAIVGMDNVFHSLSRSTAVSSASKARLEGARTASSPRSWSGDHAKKRSLSPRTELEERHETSTVRGRKTPEAGMSNAAGKRVPARTTRQIDDERVRVTEWRFAPGAATGWHRHEFDYVVVPLTTGKLLLDEPDGERFAELKAGVSYTRRAGVEHDVINANDFDFVFIEIEMKN